MTKGTECIPVYKMSSVEENTVAHVGITLKNLQKYIEIVRTPTQVGKKNSIFWQQRRWFGLFCCAFKIPCVCLMQIQILTIPMLQLNVSFMHLYAEH